MNLYIKEMYDSSALLMTDHGSVLATFVCVDDAVEECSQWLHANDCFSDHKECYFMD